MTQYEQRKKFFAEFTAKVGDTVKSIELTSLQADNLTYSALNLKLGPGRKDFWGLLVFCTNSFYFYLPPSENYFAAMIRNAAHEEAPTEQIVRLDALSEFRAALPQHHWYSFLSSAHAHTVYASFKDSNNRDRFLRLSTHCKNDRIIKTIQEYKQK